MRIQMGNLRRNSITVLIQLLLVIFTANAAAHAQTRSPDLAGHWRGELVKDGYEWNFWIDIEWTDDAPIVRVSYPDWGMFLLETSNVQIDGSKLAFTTVWLEAMFEGNVDGEFMTGTFRRSETNASARLHRASRQSKIPRTEPVSVTADDGAHLEGSLILPEGDPPYAAMVLTHGSGPDTRTTGPYIGKANRAVLSGLAVIAYDKRGAGASTGSGAYQIERLSADAKLMLDVLWDDQRIDTSRIGIGGISQGAWVAPKVAAEYPGIAFVFVTATPAISPAEQNVFSLRNRLAAEGFGPSAIRDAITAVRGVYQYYRVGTDELRQRANQLMEVGAGSWAEAPTFRRFLFTQNDSLAPNVDVASFATMFVEPLAWWREIRIPVLSVWGEDDWNVPATYSHDAIEAALRDAGNDNARLIVFPDAGHGLSAEDLPEDDWPRAAPGYVEIIADWFADRASGR
jgi:pimeloyl-ACP methyl ester carboxylesterase